MREKIEIPNQTADIGTEKNKEVDFEAIRQKIIDIASKEINKRKNGEKYNPHFIEGFDATKLNDEDLSIYESFLNHSLTPQDFNNYRKKFRTKSIKEIDEDTQSNFMMYLANQLNYLENIEWFQLKMYRELMKENRENIEE